MSSLPGEVEVARREVLAWARRDDASALSAVAAWPRLARAVAGVSRAAGLVDPNQHLERVADQVAGIERATVGWPGERSPDACLTSVAGRLERAADAARGEALSGDEQMSVRFGLASMSAVVNNHEYQLVTLARVEAKLTNRMNDPENVAIAQAAGEAALRIQASEFTSTAMHLGSLGGADGSRRTNELSSALSAWDAQAVKVLSSRPSSLALYAVSSTETMIARGYLDAVGRAHGQGLVESSELARVTDPAVERAAAWNRLRETTRPLAYGSVDLGPGTSEASLAAVQAVSTISSSFEPEDARGVLNALSVQASASRGAAACAVEVIDAGGLVAPARAMADQLKAQGVVRPVGPGLVDAAAHVRAGAAAVPAPLREVLSATAGETVEAVDGFLRANSHVGAMSAASSVRAAAFPDVGPKASSGSDQRAGRPRGGERERGWGRD